MSSRLMTCAFGRSQPEHLSYKKYSAWRIDPLWLMRGTECDPVPSTARFFFVFLFAGDRICATPFRTLRNSHFKTLSRRTNGTWTRDYLADRVAGYDCGRSTAVSLCRFRVACPCVLALRSAAKRLERHSSSAKYNRSLLRSYACALRLGGEL